jgi:hypothetical protein
MARLSDENRGSLAFNAAPIIEREHSWLDYLPRGCELPDLWRSGKSLDECLEILNTSSRSLNGKCKANCGISCQKCHLIWSKAAAAMILQKQVDKAFSGDAAMLTWYGKAVLRQQEPIANDEQIVPSVINIAGLDINQEQEIDTLRRQLDEAQRKLNELEGSGNAKGS